MKYLVLITLSFILTSCHTAKTQTPTSFYERVKNENDVYKDFLKYEGLREILETMDKEFYTTNKIIIITISNESRSALFIYDNTNDSYFFAEKNYGEKNYSYEKLTDLNEMGETNLFVLRYVLEDKIEELKKISEEAYDGSLGQYQAIHILDIKNHKYIFSRFKSFDIYKGKPVMNEEEYMESMGIKEND